MGCDIHCVIEQRKLIGQDYAWWKNRGEADIDRNYELFAVLAGVRNRHEIIPISEPKGLPEDVDKMFKAYHKDWDVDAHSASWVTLKEMREYNLDQEIEDDRIILKKNEDGRITEVCQSTTDETKTERVGKRKLFALWGRDVWDRLIKELENYDDGTGEGARLVFFFDN